MYSQPISNWIEAFAALATCLSAVATMGIALAALIQVMFLKSQVKQTNTQLGLLRSQVEQSTAHILTTASNEQNWRLFEHWKELPPFLPSWSGLTSERKWAWRVLHFNHLNLLQLAFQQHKLGLLTPDEMKSWRDKAKFWYSGLGEPNPTTDALEGREILKQVLRPEEGFPKVFRDWLVQENIIAANFFPD